MSNLRLRRRFAFSQAVDEQLAAATLAQVDAAWRKYIDPTRVATAWGGDFIRGTGAGGWAARRFAGSAWQREAKEFAFVRNTYRVLLTRARYETIIYVPRGNAADRTRLPAEFDAIADFLLACGARPLEEASTETPPVPEPLLL